MVLLSGLLVFVGCAHLQAPQSPYRTFYKSRLEGVRVPTDAEIRAVDHQEQDFSRPIEEVWRACLDLAMQSWGILGLANDADGGHQLLLISGKRLAASQAAREVILDRWLAISVEAASATSTRVDIAFVSPLTARVAPASVATDSIPPSFHIDQGRFVSSAATALFFDHLGTLLSENRYLASLAAPAHGLIQRGRFIGKERKVRPEKDQARMAQISELKSAIIRRERTILSFPLLEERLFSLARELAAAAGQRNLVTHVYVLSDSEPGCNIEANGDLFVSSGMLELLGARAAATSVADSDEAPSTDMLSGLIAHELGHLYLGHPFHRARALRIGGLSQKAWTLLATTAGALAGGLFDTSTPKSSRPVDTFLTNKQLLIGGVVGAGTLLISGRLGEGIGTEIGDFSVKRFTRAEELEADEYATELLWSAGYDYEALLQVLRQIAAKPLVDRTKKR
jgi:Zn-dependent protease with chaperone function